MTQILTAADVANATGLNAALSNFVGEPLS